MGSIKEINIKDQTYYFFNDMINVKDFDHISLKIDKKSYKNIDIYYICYITVKDSYYVKIRYLIISEVDGCIKEESGNKYLVFDSANESNEVLKKYYEIETINSGKTSKHSSAEYDRDFMKIRFFPDDNFPLN